MLPVGEAELGCLKRVLTVDPSGEPITDEGRLDPAVDRIDGRGVIGDHRHDEPRAVLVAERDRMFEVVHQVDRDLRTILPLPLSSQVADIDGLHK